MNSVYYGCFFFNDYINGNLLQISKEKKKKNKRKILQLNKTKQ